MEKLLDALKDNKSESQKAVDAVADLFGTIIGFFLCAWIIMLLWNALLPSLFGIATITYWQTCGLKILVGMICPGISARAKYLKK